MRKIAVINLKGGVAKTTTVLNLAYELAHRHERKVLVCDLDPQANATKFFAKHSYDAPGMEQVFRFPGEVDLRECICPCFSGMDIIPSNLNLDDAVTELMTDKTQEQNTVLKNVLLPIKNEYDFCIMDCPPGIGLNVINALCAADDVIIPIKIDKHALDGMEELMDVVDEIKAFNPMLKTARCLVTMYRNEPMIVGGCLALEKSRYDCFETRIRYSPKVVGSTFCREFIGVYSCRSSAAVDYRRMAVEYMNIIGGEAHA